MEMIIHSFKPRVYHSKVLVYNYPTESGGIFVKSIGCKIGTSEKDAVAGFRIKKMKYSFCEPEPLEQEKKTRVPRIPLINRYL